MIKYFLVLSILLAALACTQPSKSSAGPQAQRVAQPNRVDAAPSAPANDSSYFEALENFDKAMKATKAGSSTDRRNHTEKALIALEGTWTPMNTTLDRIQLMEGVANLAYPGGGYPERGMRLYRAAAQLRRRVQHVEVGGTQIPFRSMGLAEMEHLVESLPREGEPSTLLPAPSAPAVATVVSPAVVIEARDASSEFHSWQEQARAAVASGDLPAAAEAWTRSLEQGRTLLSDSDPTLMSIQLDLARAQIALGHLEEARRILEELLAGLSQRGLSRTSEGHAAASLLSATYKLEGDFALALEIDGRRVEECSGLPQDDPARQAAENDHRSMQLAQGDLDLDDGFASGRNPERPAGEPEVGSKPVPRRTKSVRESALVAGWLGSSGGSDSSDPLSKPPPPRPPPYHGDPATNDADFAADLAGLSQSGPKDRDARVAAREGRAQAREALGDLDLAADLRRQNLADLLETLEASDVRVQSARQSLARTLRAQGDLAGAKEQQQQACDALASALPPDHPALADARFALVALLAELDETEAALLLLERTLAAELASAVDHARLEELVRRAGELQSACRFDEAIALRREIVATGARILPQGSPALAESQRELAALLRVADLRGEARELEHRLCADDDGRAGRENLRIRALEAGAQPIDASRHAPSVNLSLVPSPSRDAFELLAEIRDTAGLARVSVVQDGVLLDLDLTEPHWTPDADGLGGRLSLSLSAPVGRPVSVVSIVAENEWSGRLVKTLTAPGKLF